MASIDAIGDERGAARKPQKQDVHGWVIIDKPVGMTSTFAVSVVKRLFCAKRAGHAGTLDPLASGCLPIALGEATKTVPFVMEGRKSYRFTVRWGEQRDTDDAEGRVIETSPQRPDAAAIAALLPRFLGTIAQVPPRFSAVKIEGERAYDLARDGEAVELEPRPVTIYRLELVETPDADHALFEAECGKGAYVRGLARDMGRALACWGHVSALRRTAVGPFGEPDMISLAELQALWHRAAAGEASLADALERTGRSDFARHGLRHHGRKADRPCRSRPRRNRPQARVQPRRPDQQRRRKKRLTRCR